MGYYMHYHIQVNVVACVVHRILDNQMQISLMTIIHASTLLIHIIFVTGRLLLVINRVIMCINPNMTKQHTLGPLPSKFGLATRTYAPSFPRRVNHSHVAPFGIYFCLFLWSCCSSLRHRLGGGGDMRSGLNRRCGKGRGRNAVCL